MKRCRPPSSATTSSPGRKCRWYVLPSRIVVPTARSSSGSTDLTLPFVPTGMKAGVGTSPWAVWRIPERATPSLAVTVKLLLRDVISASLDRVRHDHALRVARRGAGARRSRLRSRGRPARGAAPALALRPALAPLRDARAPSEHQHRVAERVEAIPLLDRDPVQPARLLDPTERHHQREQRRAGQVEVRQ